MNVYSVRDSKAEAFITPFFSKTHATAIRSAERAINEDQGFNLHPEDYDLFCIGHFDEITGKLVGLDAPAHLVSLFELKKEQ